MSTENQNPGGKPGEASGDPDDVQASKSVSYESHSKLLGEKKKLQKDYEDMKARLDAIENEKLEKEGDFKKHNETLKSQLKEQKEKFGQFSKKVSERVIKTQFAREAEKLGCVDADTAFKVCDIQDIELDDNFEFDSKSLSEKLQGLMKEKPFLFNKDVSKPRDQVPSNKGPGGKDFSQMSTEELYKELAKIK